MSELCISSRPSRDTEGKMTIMTTKTSDEFYCRYGRHMADKALKIHTARQGDYICSYCEAVRTRDWVKSQTFTRRHNDRREDYYSDED
jgi:hypothetical protein